MPSSLKELEARREKVGRDLDKHLTLRRQAQVRLREAEEDRDKKKAELKSKRKRDPGSEARIEQLEREIKTLAKRVKEFNEKVIPRLEKKEREETKRINELRARAGDLHDLIQDAKDAAAKPSINFSLGAPHWGGAEDYLTQVLDPYVRSLGYTKTSGKRSASDPLSISNPGSDHSTASTNASASDYGTFSGEDLAHKIAAKLGISNYSTGNYNGYYVQIGGRTFRAQILWAVSGHFNHVHVGLRLV